MSRYWGPQRSSAAHRDPLANSGCCRTAGRVTVLPQLACGSAVASIGYPPGDQAAGSGQQHDRHSVKVIVVAARRRRALGWCLRVRKGAPARAHRGGGHFLVHMFVAVPAQRSEPQVSAPAARWVSGPRGPGCPVHLAGHDCPRPGDDGPGDPAQPGASRAWQPARRPPALNFAPWGWPGQAADLDRRPDHRDDLAGLDSRCSPAAGGRAGHDARFRPAVSSPADSGSDHRRPAVFATGADGASTPHLSCSPSWLPMRHRLGHASDGQEHRVPWRWVLRLGRRRLGRPGLLPGVTAGPWPGHVAALMLPTVSEGSPVIGAVLHTSARRGHDGLPPHHGRRRRRAAKHEIATSTTLLILAVIAVVPLARDILPGASRSSAVAAARLRQVASAAAGGDGFQRRGLGLAL